MIAEESPKDLLATDEMPKKRVYTGLTQQDLSAVAAFKKPPSQVGHVIQCFNMILETQPGFVKQKNDYVLKQNINRLLLFIERFERKYLPQTTIAYI